MGYPIPVSYIEETYGIPQAEEGEEVLPPKATPAPFGAAPDDEDDDVPPPEPGDEDEEENALRMAIRLLLAKKKKLDLGPFAPLVERGAAAAVAPSEAFNDLIIRQVELHGLLGAQATLHSLQWPDEPDYADAAYEATLRSWMFGHLQIAMQHLGLELADKWTDLPFREAIDFFLRK